MNSSSSAMPLESLLPGSPRDEAVRVGDDAVPCSHNNSKKSRSPFQVNIIDDAAAPVVASSKLL